MEEQSKEQGIFINGKQQIIEMLQFMNEAERQKLLKNIGLRNAPMARELSEKSLSFNDLNRLPADSLRRIFSNCNPAIIALAIYPTSAAFQRKVLSSLDRGLAEQTFGIMNQNLSHKGKESKRAQEKIIQISIQMSRRQQIAI